MNSKFSRVGEIDRLLDEEGRDEIVSVSLHTHFLFEQICKT